MSEQPHGSHGDDHGHDHGHGSPFIQHHYDDAVHQFESGKLGIWLFLAQEVLFFSALFVAYVLYRHHHPEIYSYAHKYLDVKMGAINTAVLIFSSLTAAWAVRCAQLNQKKGLILCLSLTIACALTFLCVKYVEYSHKVHEHILFGRYFDPCVSSGGTELLTKNNECPGAKSTVKWNKGTEKADAGCFESEKIDQDPHQPGVQADCTTIENKLEFQGEKSHVVSRRPIAERCEEETSSHGEGAHHAQKFPCWRPAYQPAVCVDLTRGELKSGGVASRPQVGILVEYGDHEERGREFEITADCKPAPKSVAVEDPGESGQKLELGKKAINPAHVLTVHEEHEREAAGPPPEHTGMFFTIYFAMTGLHGVHVLFGVFVFIWLLIRAIKGHFTEDYFGPVDYAALYWHIVDLIWIFLFPLLYLIH